MKNNNIKLKRINKLIHINLSKIINQEKYYIKNNIITITNVITLSDLSISKIFISIFNNDDKVIEILNKASSNLRCHLSKKIKIYKIPQIKFIYDNDFNNTAYIKNLLKKTKYE